MQFAVGVGPNGQVLVPGGAGLIPHPPPGPHGSPHGPHMGLAFPPQHHPSIGPGAHVNGPAAVQHCTPSSPANRQPIGRGFNRGSPPTTPGGHCYNHQQQQQQLAPLQQPPPPYFFNSPGHQQAFNCRGGQGQPLPPPPYSPTPGQFIQGPPGALQHNQHHMTPVAVSAPGRHSHQTSRPEPFPGKI